MKLDGLGHMLACFAHGCAHREAAREIGHGGTHAGWPLLKNDRVFH